MAEDVKVATPPDEVESGSSICVYCQEKIIFVRISPTRMAWVHRQHYLSKDYVECVLSEPVPATTLTPRTKTMKFHSDIVRKIPGTLELPNDAVIHHVCKASDVHNHVRWLEVIWSEEVDAADL